MLRPMIGTQIGHSTISSFSAGFVNDDGPFPSSLLDGDRDNFMTNTNGAKDSLLRGRYSPSSPTYRRRNYSPSSKNRYELTHFRRRRSQFSLMHLNIERCSPPLTIEEDRDRLRSSKSRFTTTRGDSVELSRPDRQVGNKEKELDVRLNRTEN